MTKKTGSKLSSDKVKEVYSGLTEEQREGILAFGGLTGKQRQELLSLLKEEEKKKWEMTPQELKGYRQAWQKKISYISSGNSKESIIKASEKIPVKVEIKSDGSRLIEFEIGGKKWKILDPKLDTYFYGRTQIYHSINEITRNEVTLGGMLGDKVDDWKNKELGKYVKEKQKEGLHIPSKNEMSELLEELGKQFYLYYLPDQIALLMYLTGIDGCYRLSMGSSNERYALMCYAGKWRNLGYCRDTNDNASLLMVSCK